MVCSSISACNLKKSKKIIKVTKVSNSTLLQFKYCYHKCMKKIFGCSKHSSVTDMLFVLGLPSMLLDSKQDGRRAVCVVRYVMLYC